MQWFGVFLFHKDVYRPIWSPGFGPLGLILIAGTDDVRYLCAEKRSSKNRRVFRTLTGFLFATFAAKQNREKQRWLLCCWKEVCSFPCARATERKIAIRGPFFEAKFNLDKCVRMFKNKSHFSIAQTRITCVVTAPFNTRRKCYSFLSISLLCISDISPKLIQITLANSQVFLFGSFNSLTLIYFAYFIFLIFRSQK